MKIKTMKIGSVLCGLSAIGFMVSPCLAIGGICKSDGGYHEPTIFNTCDLIVTALENGTPWYIATGQCLGKRVPKGYYCDYQRSFSEGVCLTSENKDELVDRFEGQCKVMVIPVEEGDPLYFDEFKVKPGERMPLIFPGGCDPAKAEWFKSSSETAKVGACTYDTLL